MSEADRARLAFAMGPLSLGFDQFAGLRLNEHAFHTWDIEVVFDDDPVCRTMPPPWWSTTLPLIARFSGRPNGQERTIAVRTTDPERDFACA